MEEAAIYALALSEIARLPQGTLQSLQSRIQRGEISLKLALNGNKGKRSTLKVLG